MKKVIKDLSASVHARLSNIGKCRGRPFQEIFYYYAIECFLRRLSMSAYAQDFVLKGGLAFQGWGLPLRRPTRDIDVHVWGKLSSERCGPSRNRSIPMRVRETEPIENIEQLSFNPRTRRRVST